MKRLGILLLLFAMSNIAFAQDSLLAVLPLVDSKVTYAEVVVVENTSEKELNIRAKSWFANTFNSSQNVIQMDTQKKIIGKGFYSIRAGGNGIGGYYMQVWITITLQFDQNRFKYTITDFIGEHNVNGNVKLPLEEWNGSWGKKGRDKRNGKVYPEVNAGIQDLIKTLISEMRDIASSDDW